MHISEGVLSAPVLVGGAGLAALCVGIGLKKMEYRKVPQVAVLSSAFFVGSLIHVPAGPVSVHLVLNGINGLILGWAAFPSIFVALVLQAVLFQFGGITTLGVNTLDMGIPAIAVYYLFGWMARSNSSPLSLAAGFGTGFLAVLLGALLTGMTLTLSGQAFATAAKVVVMAHVPVMLIEGFITAVCVGFLKKVKPEVLEAA